MKALHFHEHLLIYHLTEKEVLFQFQVVHSEKNFDNCTMYDIATNFYLFFDNN